MEVGEKEVERKFRARGGKGGEKEGGGKKGRKMEGGVDEFK